MVVMFAMQKLAVFGEQFWIANVDSGGIANFQTVFNLITAVVLLPFTGVLVKISKLFVKDELPEEQLNPELHTLDEKLYISPAVALNEATKAIAAMGIIAKDNFKRGCDQLIKYDPALDDVINKNEDSLDQFADRADHFLIGLSKAIEGENEDRQLDLLMQTVPNYERIGDYATNFMELAQRMNTEGSGFSDMAIKELELLSNAVSEILSITVTAFANDDDEAAMSVEPLEEVIDDMVMILQDRHTQRLKSGACSVGSGLVFMEMLTYMERASDQCSSIALKMLGRNNEEILLNHHDYLRQIHSGNDASYTQQTALRRDQYIKPLKSIQ